MPKQGTQNGQGAQSSQSTPNGQNTADSLVNNTGTSPLSGTQGNTQNPQDLSRSLLQDTGESALNNSISPTQDGGGQISDNKLLMMILELLSRLMDNQKSQFGDPQSGSDDSGGMSTPTTSGGGSGGGTPSAGGGGIGGGTPSVGGGGTGGGTPSVGGGGTGGGTPSVGGGGMGGDTPSVGGDTSFSGGATSPTSSTGIGATGGTRGLDDVSFPTADNTNAIVLHEPIKVGAGEVFDGKGKTYTAGPELGTGDQKEGQKPLFEVADGGSVKNVILGDNGADGIHLHGDANIDNVHWTNVGEDALTVKDNVGGKPANVNITNSSAQGASDKIFQLNADANFNVDNFKAKDFGTFVRTNGGQQGNWNLNLSNIDAENGKFSFVKSDSEGLNVDVSNATLNNVKNHYKVPESTHLQVK
ncbi:pectate lyase [Prodigiosinella confusarubida]